MRPHTHCKQSRRQGNYTTPHAAPQSSRGSSLQGGSGVRRGLRCTISQVRPAQHTVILESLQRRAFYPRPRRPHAAFRPRSSSAHPDAHHPRPASIRPPTPLPPPGRPPAAAAPDGNPAMQASTRPCPHPACADTAHTPMHATRNRPTGPAHAAAPAAGIPDVGLKGASGPATGIDRPCTESSAGARGASDEGRGSS